MLDAELADLYGVATKGLLQAVKRNRERFPDDFMIQLTAVEWDALRSQSVTSSAQHGGRRYLPYAFTEQGVAMLSSVLRSRRAIAVNVQIMRAFVRMRELLFIWANEPRSSLVFQASKAPRIQFTFGLASLRSETTITSKRARRPESSLCCCSNC